MNGSAQPPKHPLVAQGWNNCPKCGYFYKQAKVDECPMCHWQWRLQPGYSQPPYEKPGLE
jgi:hypothetical protein